MEKAYERRLSFSPLVLIRVSKGSSSNVCMPCFPLPSHYVLLYLCPGLAVQRTSCAPSGVFLPPSLTFEPTT